MLRVAFMSFSCPTLTLDQMLALAQRLGYDGIEPRIGSGHQHGIELDSKPEVRREARSKAQEARMPYCCLATSCRFSDPANVKQHVEDARRAIDLAGDIGCPRLRVFGGAIGEGLHRDSAIEHAGAALASLAEQAAHRNVTICLETHDDWCNPHHVARLMRRVNHPNVAVNWDIMHPVRVAGVSMDEAYHALAPFIRHVHFHDGVTEDGKLRMVPIGQGAIDHGRAMELLAHHNFDGYCSGEWINWEPCETHLPRELDLIRKLITEAMQA